MSDGIHVLALNLELSIRLDSLFGNEDTVKGTRAFISSFNRTAGHFTSIHFIGSKCDGCDGSIFKDSDIDRMLVHNKCVVDASYEVRNTSSSLLAVTSPRSSSVQIHLGKQFTSADLPLDNTIIYYNNRMLLSSSLFKLYDYPHLLLYECQGIAGPSAVRNYDISSNDNVVAFRCKSWPKISTEWIYRPRKYSWPKPKLVNFIKSKGCHYVPIGEYNSPFYNLEWRVSFVLSECALVRSFNHVQFKVYCLLKLLKTHLQSVSKHPITQESLITSYHMKTIVFFAIENSPKSLWSNQNIILCFRMCFVYLRNAVISNYLPHYFLPKCNLFKKLSETNQEQTNISGELNRYKYYPLVLIKLVLKEYDPHDSFNYAFRNEDFDYMDKKLKQFHYITNMRIYCWLLPQTTKKRHMLIHSMLDNIHSFSDFEFILVTKMTLDNIYKNSHYNERGMRGNKTSWVTKRRAKYIYLRITHCDVASGWLQLSTFYYVTNQYAKAEHICRKVITSITSEVFHAGRYGDMKSLKRTLSNHPMNIQQGIKRFTANYVSLYADGLYPNEIDIEVVNYDYAAAVRILPLPYAYFVLFLCAYHRSDVVDQCEILVTLESLINNSRYGLRIRDENTFIILDMVGICYELLRDTQKATFYYWKSINTRDPHNGSNHYAKAADIRLKSLLMKRE